MTLCLCVLDNPHKHKPHKTRNNNSSGTKLDARQRIPFAT